LHQIFINARNKQNQKLDTLLVRQQRDHAQDVTLAKEAHRHERLSIARVMHLAYLDALRDLGVSPNSDYYQKVIQDYAKKYSHQQVHP
jgi:ABC-type enterochelin transport system substrate-binding protein